MASIFISHSSRDAAVCDAVGLHLQQRGHSPLFVHRHPGDSDFIGDQDWASEVGKRAATYEIFIALLSSAWHESDECRLEAKFASRSGRTMLPLRLDPDAPVPDWARANIIPFSRAPSTDDWHTLEQALIRVGANPDAFEPHPERKPFPGLHAFEREDAAVYFGRDGAIRQLRELLRRMRRGDRESEQPRQCLIVGPSGAGKSSLMRAGVLARLERERHEWLCPATVTPSGDLVAALTDVLTDTTGLSRPRIRKALTSGAPEHLNELVTAAREHQGQAKATLLLAIDQMEEAFAPQLIDDTLALLEAHKAMETALDDPMPLVILGTLRADSYAGLCDRTDVAALPLATYRVAPLPIEYLSEVIRGPLQVWRRPVRDVDIEPAVVERMLADARRISGGAEAGSGDVLPLVAIALRQLWDDHAHTDWFAGLTEGHYEETGGLSAIIDAQVTRALRKIERETGIAEAELLDALIPTVATTDTRGKRVRAWSAESAFDTCMQSALKILCDARLLHTDTRASSDDGCAETVYSVAHEVILRQWTGLALALDQQVEQLMLKARIRDEAAAWARINQPRELEAVDASVEPSTTDPDSYLLLEGDRLAQARALAQPDGEPAEVGAYIAACEAKQNERVETLAEREWRLDQARQQYLSVRARELSDRGDHLAAMRLALAAWPASGEESVHGALAAALALATQRSATRIRLAGHSEAITALAWSPDGHRLVSGDDAGQLMLWNATTGEPIGQPLMGGHTDSIQAVAWSPDGLRLISADSDGELILWDGTTGEQLVDESHTGSRDSKVLASRTLPTDGCHVLNGNLRGQAPLSAWALSPDGSQVAVGDLDGELLIGDMATEAPVGPAMIHPEISYITHVVWSPDGSRLVSGSNFGKFILWDPATREPIGQSTNGYVTAVAWSPDGSRLVTGYIDGTLTLWDAITGEPAGQAISGHTKTITAVTWSPDGRWLVSGDDVGTLLIWDGTTGKPISRLLTGGHTNAIKTIAWSPDGCHLVSGDIEGELILSNAMAGKPISERLADRASCLEADIWSNHDRWLVTDSRFSGAESLSPDGNHLITKSVISTLVVYDMESNELVRQLITGSTTGCISAAAWSPDGQQLVSSDENGKLVLWDPTSGEPLRALMTGDPSCRIEVVAWAPDGRRLVCGGGGGTLTLWDTSTGQPIRQAIIDHTATITAVEWSPDARQLVCGDRHGTLTLWDAATGNPVGQPMTDDQIGRITAVAWSPDGRQLVCGDSNGKLFLWDTTTGKTICDPVTDDAKEFPTLITAVAWSPDGYRLVSGDTYHNTLTLWDARTIPPSKRSSMSLPTEVEALNEEALAFYWNSNLPRMVTTTAELLYILWDIGTGKRIGGPIIRRQNNWSSTVAWSPDGRRFASFDTDPFSLEDAGMILWDVMIGGPVGTRMINDQIDLITVVDWSPNGRLLVSGDAKGKLILWDTMTGEQVGQPITNDQVDRIKAAAWSPDGRQLVSGYDDGKLILWDAMTGESIGQPMTGPIAIITTVDWSPDGRQLVIVGEGRNKREILELRDAMTGQPVSKPMTGHIEAITTVAWSPDGRRLVSGDRDGKIILWDALTGEPVSEPMAIEPSAEIRSLVWLPDGRHLVIACQKTVIRLQLPWECLLAGNALAQAVARRRLRGAEQLGEPECRILRELHGHEPDPDLIPNRWGRGGSEDDPFGNPLEETGIADEQNRQTLDHITE